MDTGSNERKIIPNVTHDAGADYEGIGEPINAGIRNNGTPQPCFSE